MWLLLVFIGIFSFPFLWFLCYDACAFTLYNKGLNYMVQILSKVRQTNLALKTKLYLYSPEKSSIEYVKLNLIITYWIFEFQIAHPLVLRVDFHQLAENPACLFSNPISSPLLSPFWCLLHLQHFYPLRLLLLPPLPTQKQKICKAIALRYYHCGKSNTLLT